MQASVGDTIVVEAERVDQAPRRGTVEEVLREEPPRFRVRWEDGHESIFTPAAGSARVAAAAKKPAAAKKR